MLEITFNHYNNMFKHALKAGNVPAMFGDAGIGKSAFVKEKAKELGTQAFVLKINSMAGREDISGQRMIPTNDAKTDWAMKFFPALVVSNAVKYAQEHPDETPILFLDEFNRTTPDVTSAVFQFITEREVGDIKLPDNLLLVAAGNDSGNVTALDDASVNRLAPVKVIPDLGTFLTKNPDLNGYVEQFLRSHATLLLETPTTATIDFDDDDPNLFDDQETLVKQYASPRSWSMLSRHLNASGLTVMHDNAERQAFDDYLIIVNNETNATLLDVTIESYLGETQAAQQFKDYMASQSGFTVQATPNPSQIQTNTQHNTRSVIEPKVSSASTQDDINNLAYELNQTQLDPLQFEFIFSKDADNLNNIENLRSAILKLDASASKVLNAIVTLYSNQYQSPVSTQTSDLLQSITSKTAQTISNTINALGL